MREPLSKEDGHDRSATIHRRGCGARRLAGNCYEWTSSTITATNGAEAGLDVLAVRGGSWYATSRSCRTTYRGEGRDPSGGYATVGLRVAAAMKP